MLGCSFVDKSVSKWLMVALTELVRIDGYLLGKLCLRECFLYLALIPLYGCG